MPGEDLLADEADLSERAAGEPSGDLEPDKLLDFLLLDFFDDSSPESDCLLDDEALLSESDPESRRNNNKNTRLQFTLIMIDTSIKRLE